MEGIGQRFGKYEVVRTLASGGMGEVLLARQAGVPGFQRTVVVKKVLPHLSQDTEFVQRFLDEMRVAAMLNHGNIVQVFEAGEFDGQYYMAMEYVDGLDLKEALAALRASGQRMPEHLALYVLIEVAKALDHAHGRRDDEGRPLGIVHRDVSPANLLLAFDGQVKLADFGVAKAAARLSLSLPGTLHGKVYYMSPEQVSGQDVDARSDVFSLGVVAYEMLAGKRPFEGDTDVAVLDAVRRCSPPPLASAAPWVPPSLRAIVERALVRDPSERYPAMHDFQQALTAYMLEAHTIVSARALSEFLGQLVKDRPAPPTLTPPRSLDDLAADLLRADQPAPGPAEPSPKTRTVMTPGDSAPVASPPQRHGWVRVVVAASAVLVAVAIALVAAGLPDGAPVPDESSQAVPVPVPEAPPPRGPEAPAPLPSPAVAAIPAPAPAPSVAPETVEGRPAAGRRLVHVRSVPSGAEVWQGDTRLGVAPLDVPVPKTGAVRLDVRLDGYAPKSLVVGPESPAGQAVTLARLATGRVRFRFFPADARVYVDDRQLATKGNNLVSLEIPEGEHVLRVQTGDGEHEKVMRFGVRALETTELGTVEVTAPVPAASPTERAPAAKTGEGGT